MPKVVTTTLWSITNTISTPTYFANIYKFIVNIGQSLACVASAIDVSSRLHNQVVFSGGRFRQVDLWAKRCTSDTVKKRLGIEVVECSGKNVIPIVHCNP